MKFNLTNNPAYAEDGVTEVGTYSINPATGEVTFTPTDKKNTLGKVTQQSSSRR